MTLQVSVKLGQDQHLHTPFYRGNSNLLATGAMDELLPLFVESDGLGGKKTTSKSEADREITFKPEHRWSDSQ